MANKDMEKEAVEQPSDNVVSDKAAEEPSGIAFTLRALRYRNYRLFFTGQTVSLIGTWMSRVATSWLVYKLTGSALLLGVIGFAGQIPSFVLAPFAGVLIDRWNRHRILVVTQILSLVQSLLMAVFALSGHITIAWIFALSIFQGLINTFDMPARQSFVVQMVENRADLSNAIALNSSMVNGARLLGPSIAGVLIAAVGEGWCFLTDAISYIPVIISLLMMRIRPQDKPQRSGQNALRELVEGWRYVSGSGPIRAILLLLALINLVGLPYTVLMPIIATTILKGGPSTLGILMAATGVGALCGALVLASRHSVQGLERLIPLVAVVAGGALILFSFSHVLWLSLLLMPVIGFGFMMQMASSNTLLQTITEDDKRGRVMSFFTMAFAGTAPFGSLLMGWAANWIGTLPAIRLGGSICIVGAYLFYRVMSSYKTGLIPSSISA